MDRKLRNSMQVLSNSYEGVMPNNYEGVLPNRYTGGFSERRPNFDGDEAVTFADEAQLSENQQFAFTIQNTGSAAVDRLIALCPGYFNASQIALIKDNRGNSVDAIIKEGLVIGTAGTDGLEVVSENKPIDELLQFSLYNPTRFVGIKLQCSNPSQFSQAINIKQQSPYRNLDDYTIIPDSYKDSRQFDQTRVEIPLENFQFDNNTQVVWKVLKGTTVSVTFFGGAVLNMAKMLAVTAARMRNGLSRTYGPDYLKNSK